MLSKRARKRLRSWKEFSLASFSVHCSCPKSWRKVGKLGVGRARLNAWAHWLESMVVAAILS
eukprot:8387178-Alexandrium_andersonii.AAC.1